MLLLALLLGIFLCHLPNQERKILLSAMSVLGTEMKHLNSNEKNNSIVTAKVLSLAIILVVAIGVSTAPLTALVSRFGGGVDPGGEQ
jgi:hypothetical protein